MKIDNSGTMFSSVMGVKRYRRLLPVLLVAVVALILAASAPAIWANKAPRATIPFADAKIIFETNFSDEDTGIQISLDGEPWQRVGIKGPGSRSKLLAVDNKGDLQDFGLTEMFFESNEPNYDDLSLAETLALFPPGEYQFEGETVEGETLVGAATLNHELPCGPEVNAAVGGADDVVISWDPVTEKIDPGTESCVAGGPAIEGYQIIVENDHTFTVDLPAGATSVSVPPEFLEPGTDYVFEVLAIAENGNQTITEDEFSTP